jgi:hypothetical protein
VTSPDVKSPASAETLLNQPSHVSSRTKSPSSYRETERDREREREIRENVREESERERG